MKKEKVKMDKKTRLHLIAGCKTHQEKVQYHLTELSKTINTMKTLPDEEKAYLNRELFSLLCKFVHAAPNDELLK